MASILVTGVGAVIGYGVLRSIAGTGHRLIGLDIHADAYGQHLSDAFVQALPTADPAYPDFIEGVLHRHKPDLILPCIEQDVERFDTLRGLFSNLGIACCLNTSELIAIANDKWRFHEAELAHGLILRGPRRLARGLLHARGNLLLLSNELVRARGRVTRVLSGRLLLILLEQTLGVL